MIPKVTPIATTLAAVALIAGPAMAQESTNLVETSTDWSIFVEDDPTSCWGVAPPSEQVNTRSGERVSVSRGDTLLMVSYIPSQNVKGQVSWTGGYPLAPGRSVTVTIGDTSVQMTTVEGEWAWADTPEDDARLIAAMKRGANAVVSARSSRGTDTRDTFSLMGFTAAVEEAARRCDG
ncbi:MAG: invasion associated locus B family protein [Paracoccaceae bacterium]|nr:invasion associated locus B family protein [Paracoccaceae bacterium]